MKNPTKLKPVNNHLLVKTNVDTGEEINDFGFVVTRSESKHHPMKATVVDVADEFDAGYNVEVGDIVVLPKSGSIKVTADGEEYHLCHKNDVIGVIHGRHTR